YELLSGKSAFPGTSAPDVIRKILVETPERLHQHRPDTPPALADMVMQMLAKTPEARPSLEATLETLANAK
ncbi:MAG: serine/threonine protein kinase, partial [bacterium]|nr:serine/threonine protein kinase [bacterium]